MYRNTFKNPIYITTFNKYLELTRHIEKEDHDFNIQII